MGPWHHQTLSQGSLGLLLMGATVVPQPLGSFFLAICRLPLPTLTPPLQDLNPVISSTSTCEIPTSNELIVCFLSTCNRKARTAPMGMRESPRVQEADGLEVPKSLSKIWAHSILLGNKYPQC